MKRFLYLGVICIVISVILLFYAFHTNNARNIALSRDSLSSETWLEVEKNETVKICLDSKVKIW